MPITAPYTSKSDPKELGKRARKRGQNAPGLSPMLSNGWIFNVIAVPAAVCIADVSRKAGRWTSRLVFHALSISEYLRASQTMTAVNGAHASHVRIPHEKMRHAV